MKYVTLYNAPRDELIQFSATEEEAEHLRKSPFVICTDISDTPHRRARMVDRKVLNLEHVFR